MAYYLYNALDIAVCLNGRVAAHLEKDYPRLLSKRDGLLAKRFRDYLSSGCFREMYFYGQTVSRTIFRCHVDRAGGVVSILQSGIHCLESYMVIDCADLILS